MTEQSLFPVDELERLQDLYALNLLDTPPEERFEHFIQHARELYNVPVAFISLIDVQRQWFKACQGLSISETSRDISFCAHTILHNQLMLIPDALLDARFVHNPLVTGPPFIRFYAGYPLRGPRGYAVGTLCIVDFIARDLNLNDLRPFEELALQVEQEVNSTTDHYNQKS